MNQLIPNSTQIPNIVSDFIFPRIPEAEMKCFFYICRRTFGFHKEMDRISLTQFIEGLHNKDKKFDLGTGLARASVVSALKNLVNSGLVEVVKTRAGNYYKINLLIFDNQDPIKTADQVIKKLLESREKSKTEQKNKPKQRRLLIVHKSVDKGVVQNLNQFKIQTGSSSKFEPIPVQNLNLQKKGNKGNKEIANAKNKNCESLGDILKNYQPKSQSSKNQKWQDLALEIIQKIPDANNKKPSVFRCCKENEQMAKIAMLDTLELGKPYVLYFLKVFNSLNKKTFSKV
jgi:hypothetical protein